MFEKVAIRAFAGTPLLNWLIRRDVSHGVLAGVVTHCAVLTTALTAFDHGMRVSIVTDAGAAADPTRHDAALAILQLAAQMVMAADVKKALASAS